VLSLLLDEGRIDPVTFAIGHALSEFSNDAAENVWPAQQTIGKKVGRSGSTVCRRLRVLRELGMLEWDHRFEGDTNERKGIRGTSNFYEFRIPDDLAEQAGLHRHRRHRRPDRTQRHPSPAIRVPALGEWQGQVDSTAAAIARSAATFAEAEAEIESLYSDLDAGRVMYARNALEEAWQQHRAPPRRSDE